MRRLAAALLVALAACGGDSPSAPFVAPTAASPSATPSAAATTTSPPAAPRSPSPSPTAVATTPAPRSSSPRPRRTATPAPPRPAVPPFRGSIEAAPRDRMTHSWRAGCPVAIEDLRLLRVDHWTFGGGRARGELVVHESVAAPVLRAMEGLWRARYPIRRMRLVDEYGGDDDRSMAADNTSAFNCRYVKGTTRWSEHSYGKAIDVNPVENPYVYRDGRADPPAGQPYADRSRRAPGMIHAGDAVVDAFAAIGWRWGGYWSGAKDYQHFSRSGR